MFNFIDPKYLSNAEKDIKEYFETNEKKVKYENFKELILINPKNRPQIIKQFKMIGNEYAGCVRELMIQIENLKIKHQSEIDVMKAKIQTEEVKTKLIEERNAHLEEKLKYETETLKHKLEIEKLNNQILIEKLKK